MPAKRGVTATAARTMILALPGVSEGVSYGTPSWTLGKRFIARVRDDDTVMVVKCGDIERDLREVIEVSWRQHASRKQLARRTTPR